MIDTIASSEPQAASGRGQPPAPIVTMRKISKRFGGAVALDRVDLQIYAGEVLAIVGDNGAGKSTLIKILTGVLRPSDGQVFVDETEVHFHSHGEAAGFGIDAVYQTLAIANDLTPPANIFFGNELTRKILGIPILDNAGMRVEAERILMERFGTRLPDLSAPTESLSGGQRQAVAIARAIRHGSLRLLVMDEPTAALGPQETARTLQLISGLRDQGMAVLLISHSLDDVFAVADRIQVLRRGKRVGVVQVAETTREEVLGLIVGAGEMASLEND